MDRPFGRPNPAVIKYYLYQLTISVGFIWPIFTLFLLWNDLTYTQIGTLGSLSAVLVVVFELPTGYLADRVGRRAVLALGIGTMAVSTAGFVVVDTFPGFVGLYVLWALGIALQHGTDDAWLYAMLQAETDEQTFTRIRGRGGAVYQVGSAVTMIIGGLLYVVHPTAPFLASALLNGAGVPVVLTMPRNDRFETGDESADPLQPLTVLREQFTWSAVGPFVLFAALFFGLVQTADTYIQPITVDAIEGVVVDGLWGVSLPAVPIPPEATLGVVYAGFALVAAVASYNAERIRDWVGLRTTLVLVPLGVAVALLVPLTVSLLAVPVFFLMKGGKALTAPLVNQYLNDRTGEAGRATVLSAASMSYAFVRAPLKPVVGAVADVSTPVVAVGGLAGGFLLVALVLFALETPVEPTTSTAPSESQADPAATSDPSD